MARWLSGRIEQIAWLTNNKYGTGRAYVIIEPSDCIDYLAKYRTMDNAGFVYGLGNPGMGIGDTVYYRLTEAGRIRTMVSEVFYNERIVK